MRTRDSRVNKEFILANINKNELESQIDIFEKYLGITNIRTILKDELSFCNPLRIDDFPTCTFKVFLTKHGYKLWFRDWAEIRGYDCFDLVQNMANCGFNDALELIAYHFNLLSAERAAELKYIMDPITILELNQRKTKPIELRVKTTEWTKEHVAFWKQYNLDIEDLDDDIVPIKCYWLNGNKFNVPKNIGFVYMFGGFDYKIYLPFADRSKRELKFIHNRADILQGQGKVDFSKRIILLTSSYKDVKLLKKLNKLYDLNITSAAPMSETTPISSKVIDFLKGKFDYVILYHNNDKAGLKAAATQSVLYDCFYIHNPEGEEKDPSDMSRKHGLEYTANTIKTLLYHVVAPF